MADGFPQSLFEQVYRRVPTDSDRTRLLVVRSALGLSDRDELWPVIMTLDHYTLENHRARHEILKALQSLPEQVQATISGVEASASAKADQAIARSVEKGAERLTRIVAERSRTTEDRISKRQLTVAATVGAVVALLCLGIGASGGYLVTEAQLTACTSETFITSDGRTGCYVD